MTLHSITNPGISVSFTEAARCGIADDGGLFMPDVIPALSPGFFQSLHSLSFHEIACHVAGSLLDGEIPAPDLRRIVEESMTFPVHTEPLDDRTSILELYHGPTLAFKDFGARFMARMLAYIHRHENTELTILVATSGDTGSAVAHGFHNVPGMRVVLLYPSGRVSAIQEQQLTTVGGNVTALEIEGTFDDCQRLVKQAFADPSLRTHVRLTSANSINIARLLPQTFYYFDACAHLHDHTLPLVFSVPSGNLGNLTAGLIAWKMGLPVRRFIAATNANDIVPRFLASGVYTPVKAVATLSNAMDVGDPSNMSRVLHLFNGDLPALRRVLSSASFSDDQTRDAIREVYRLYGRILDPHGAVAYLALRLHDTPAGEKYHGVVLETAHPAKFPDAYDETIRNAILMPDRLRSAINGRKQSLRLSSRFEELKSALLNM
jgi:threonine synthase